MRQRAGGAPLPQKPFDMLFVDAVLVLEDLQRHAAVDVRIIGLVDIRHGTGADVFSDLIAADRFAEHVHRPLRQQQPTGEQQGGEHQACQPDASTARRVGRAHQL